MTGNHATREPPEVDGGNIRRRIHVEGVVQGVGFRPFIYALATELGLSGFVGNDSSGVFIEIEGTSADVELLIDQLQFSPPPNAHIDRISTAPITPIAGAKFTIVGSNTDVTAATLISPDLSTCTDCLCEFFDPTDRRYRYPFINCTNCGPRFTIIEEVPYDRARTTMAEFPMCSACRAEYDDPLDRRFHAQPNACPICGPQIQYSAFDAQYIAGAEAVASAQQALAKGGVVAVKGLGGFHLACDGTNDAAVSTLRRRKGRADKPFALMVADIASARLLAHIDEREEALLSSRERPIVLLNKRTNSPLSPAVAPGNRTVGIMLPYTPLHYLLFQQSTSARLKFLIMTSANLSGHPIIKDNGAAQADLATIADGILLHNRTIHVHCDDSVVRIFCGVELPIRRSRGYAPFPVKLPFALRPTLAVGGELKSTFCLTNGSHAFMSPHIGDMKNLETFDAFGHMVGHMQKLFHISPEIVACDLHPGYLSTRWAGEQHGDCPLHKIQHHHAHIAAVMTENGVAVDEQVIGFAFDGTGYARDEITGKSAIWGGEVLLAGYGKFVRAAHLSSVPLPGGDGAIQRPYRMALAHLWAAGVEWSDALPAVAAASAGERTIIKQQLERNINTVTTSSMGRLFDAVATLAGMRPTITYEGQATIEFEAMADRDAKGSYAFDLSVAQTHSQAPVDDSYGPGDYPLRFGAVPVIQGVAADVRHGVPTATIAMRFHRAVARLMVDLALRLRNDTDINVVALSGGVFQNVLLLELALEHLEAHEFRVLTHRLVPPNDGGLALGQAVIANCMHKG